MKNKVILVIMLLAVVSFGACSKGNSSKSTSSSLTATSTTATSTESISSSSLGDIINFADQSFVYDGKAKKLTIEEEYESLIAKVTYTENQYTDAGKYNVTATVLTKSGKTMTLTACLTITKAVPTINQNDIKVTKDTDYEVLASVTNSDGIMSLEYFKSDGSVLTEKPSEVGEYQIRITLSEGKNYLSATKTIKLSIANNSTGWLPWV